MTYGSVYLATANSGHSALRALVMGMGQNSLKTLPVWAYQGKMTCESMVRLREGSKLQLVGDIVDRNDRVAQVVRDLGETGELRG
jgi:hypothetical protein